MNFSENLKTLRIANGLSQKELAEKLGFSFQSISKWERNESLPDIETVLAIAAFFGTSTDSLLGYTPQAQLATLKIESESVKIFTEYPNNVEDVTKLFLLVIDGNGKIAATLSVVPHRGHVNGYIRSGYYTVNDESPIVFVARNIARIAIPEGGFIIAFSPSEFVAKQIMQFIIPEEYAYWLDPETHPGYSCNGRYLFADILKWNELDHITAELCEGGMVFKKPAASVEPVSANIETLAKIVRKELERKHNKQFDELSRGLEELSERFDDIESRDEEAMDIAEESRYRIDDLESRLKSLEALLNEAACRTEALEALLEQKED